MKTLVPVGTASTVGLPMLNVKKQTQSVRLWHGGQASARWATTIAKDYQLDRGQYCK